MEAASKQLPQKTKRRETKIENIYSRGLISRNIVLPITNIGKNIKETIEENIKANFEGKCLVEGFIKPNSANIISHSSGLIVKGNLISFEVIFECEICFPVEGMLISCVAKNITKAGIKAESALDIPSPVIVFIARDHHYNFEHFTNIKEGDKITVRVLGQRFELNDKFVSVIGELVKPKEREITFKPKAEQKARIVYED
jgi:DNA-directed RNA polymerase subunit E'/Rpb7